MSLSWLRQVIRLDMLGLKCKCDVFDMNTRSLRLTAILLGMEMKSSSLGLILQC